MLPRERECADKLMVQYSSGRFGVSADYLNVGDAIEVKIGQGAKPGMGGHLLAEKVSPKVAEIRGIPLGTDALSPARFWTPPVQETWPNTLNSYVRSRTGRSQLWLNWDREG
nr:glutamate synthase-related protein [Methanobacterium formicicum]